MAKLNISKAQKYTHEGAVAATVCPEMQLERSVMACLLWEDEFYEDGLTISERICRLIEQTRPDLAAALARKARNQMKLRHVPLLIAREMARYPKHRGYVADLIADIVQRPDEMTEFLALYWKDGKSPVSAQVKKGLARAFPKFDAYQLAKYNRKGLVRLRDVMFLCHPKPVSDVQKNIWEKLADDSLESPDTWEVHLSSGDDRKKTWERLLGKNKLGALALLRNLRNFEKAGVPDRLVKNAIRKMKTDKILPFRFIAAAGHAPKWELLLEKAMLKSLRNYEKMPGRTVLLIDVSGSMDMALSSRSELSRLDAACGVAILLREICEDLDILSFSWDLRRIPKRHGFALRDAIVSSQAHGGTLLGAAVRAVYASKRLTVKSGGRLNCGLSKRGLGLKPDRLIVITDEQSHDPVPSPMGRGYMINVASCENGVGYGHWIHVDGWSEAVIDYILSYERRKRREDVNY